MSKYKVGEIVELKVSGITNYGFFVDGEDSYTGLCHISEVSHDYVDDVHNFVHDGEIIYAQILDIDYELKHMKISIKNIYYKTEEDDSRIVESRKGFLPLKNMLPKWIETKLKEYKK